MWPPPASPAPNLPTHLQLLGWRQQDPSHVQSHVPLAQNHGRVTAQVRCQLEGSGLDGVSLALALVGLPTLEESYHLSLHSSPPSPLSSTVDLSLHQPDISSHLPGALQSSTVAPSSPSPSPWLRGGKEAAAGGPPNSPPGSQGAHCTSPQKPGLRTRQAAPRRGFLGPDGPPLRSSEERPRASAPATGPDSPPAPLASTLAPAQGLTLCLPSLSLRLLLPPPAPSPPPPSHVHSPAPRRGRPPAAPAPSRPCPQPRCRGRHSAQRGPSG